MIEFTTAILTNAYDMFYGNDSKSKKARKKTSNRLNKISSKRIKTKSKYREEQCRDIFEGLLKEKFISCRPNWLKNPKTNHNLELDGYCEKLKLAFEYDGEQHHVFPNTFHKTKKDYVDQIKRDNLKTRLCKLNNVYLIRIPWYVKDLEEYIREELDVLRIIKNRK